MEIRHMRESDYPSVASIYKHGIDTGDATFETHVPEWQAWDRAHLAAPRLVADKGDGVTGWAALSPVSDRCSYTGVAEISVYVAPEAQGHGLGTDLLTALVTSSEHRGIWTLQAGIFPENRASVAIHERCGFRIVGLRERLGKLDGGWRDVLLLERRSHVVGVD